ncbi:MAG: type II toxin-antitoxin system RelE/ParE family toxin [Chloroflexi bacterium]|nr:type II toxin-antitoxin system RelE/ParE family toxin [Chloroflexota bacterium]
MYEIRYDSAAARNLRRIRGSDLERITKAIASLGGNPRPHGTSKLHGNTHRIRVGDWRIIYVVDDASMEVSITDILRRNERTYRNI